MMILHRIKDTWTCKSPFGQNQNLLLKVIRSLHSSSRPPKSPCCQRLWEELGCQLLELRSSDYQRKPAAPCWGLIDAFSFVQSEFLAVGMHLCIYILELSAAGLDDSGGSDHFQVDLSWFAWTPLHSSSRPPKSPCCQRLWEELGCQLLELRSSDYQRKPAAPCWGLIDTFSFVQSEFLGVGMHLLDLTMRLWIESIYILELSAAGLDNSGVSDQFQVDLWWFCTGSKTLGLAKVHSAKIKTWHDDQ